VCVCERVCVPLSPSLSLSLSLPHSLFVCARACAYIGLLLKEYESFCVKQFGKNEKEKRLKES